MAWRLITACRLAGGPYDGILLDRGLRGALHRRDGAAAADRVAPPGGVTGRAARSRRQVLTRRRGHSRADGVDTVR